MKDNCLNILSGEDLHTQIVHYSSHYEQKIKKMLLSKLAFSYGNNIEIASLVDFLRVCKAITHEERVDKTVANIILNTFVDAENRVCGSGAVAVIVFLKLFPNFLKLNRLASKKEIALLEENILGDLHDVLTSSRRISSLEILNTIRSFNRDLESIDLVTNSLYAAGSAGNINIEKSEKDFSSVVKREGYKFDVSLDENFLGSAPTREIYCQEPKVLIVDGTIEDTKEIDNIIREAHRRLKQLIIFARGYSEGVTTMLAANYSSRIVEVFPFTVNFDENGANQLVDLAICVGSDVISSHKGESLESVTWDSLPLFDSCTISRHSIKVFNSTSLQRCREQRARLLRQLDESQYDSNEAIREMKIKILNRRINSMTPSNTIVRVGNRKKSIQSLKYDRACKSIEFYNEISRWGAVLVKSTACKKNLSFINDFYSLCGINFLSARMLAAGVKVAVSNIKSVLTVGAWLKNEAA